MYDFDCTACSHQFEALVPHGALPPCPACAAATERAWRRTAHVRPDSVPGGFWVENLDATPRYFDSNSTYQQELKARNLTNDRFHSVNPRGPYSTKW